MKPKKKETEADKPKLSETLKSITGNDLGKVQVAEQDKSNKKKLKRYQRSYCCKSSNTKRQGIKIKRWFKQKSVTVSAKDFEGEVTLKFEIETNQWKKVNEN
nr:hypothetical protein [Mycoplasmopsis bovis]